MPSATSAARATGGVARNVAENLARLGVRTQLIAAVGRDAPGEWLLRETAASGVDLRSVVRTGGPTGSYTAVLDDRGELLVRFDRHYRVTATDGENVDFIPVSDWE